jgi:hypothetical protein
MGINKYDISAKVAELSSATKEKVAMELGEEADSKNFAKAFENAASHGLIATQAADKDDAAAEWTQTGKGKQKVAENA